MLSQTINPELAYALHADRQRAAEEALLARSLRAAAAERRRENAANPSRMEDARPRAFLSTVAGRR